MKNLVEPIQLSEPVKAVKQPISAPQNKAQQHSDETTDQNDFQTMLEQQKHARNSQASNKTTEKNSTKSDADTLVQETNKTADVAKATPKAEEQEKVQDVDDTVATTDTKAKNMADKVNSKISKEVLKGKEGNTVAADVSKKEVTETENDVDTAIINKAPKPAKGNADKAVNDFTQSKIAADQEKSVSEDAPKIADVKTKKTASTESELSSKTKDNTVKEAEEKPTTKKNPKVKVADLQKQTTIKSEEVESADVKPVDLKSVKVASNKKETSGTDLPEEQPIAETDQIKQADIAVKHVAANVTEKGAKAVKSSVAAVTKAQTKQTATIEKGDAGAKPIADDSKEMVQKTEALTDVKDVDVSALTPAKESYISKLQKDALEKRQLAKQLQHDLNAEKSKITGDVKLTDGMSKNQTLEGAALGRSTDFLQTAHQQAQPVKQSAARAQQAESAKANASAEVDSVNEAIATTTPTSAVGVTTMASQSSLMAASALGSSNQIYSYPGKPGWNQAISQKVMYMVGAGDQTARLNLNPPELGPLQVVIQVNNEKADATFISDNSEVRQALEDGMEHLREKMEDAGLSLGQANVGAGQNFAQQEKSGFGQRGEGKAKGVEVSSESEPTTSQPVQSRNNGLVDTFV